MSTPSPQREWLVDVQTTSWGCDCPYAYTARLGTQLQQDSKLAIQKNIMAEQIFQVWVINYYPSSCPCCAPRQLPETSVMV